MENEQNQIKSIYLRSQYAKDKFLDLNPDQEEMSSETSNFLDEILSVKDQLTKTPEQEYQLEKKSKEVYNRLEQDVIRIQKKSSDFVTQMQNNSSFALLGLYEIFRQQGCKVLLTDKAQENDSASYIFQKQILLTGQTQNIHFIELVLNTYKTYTYEYLMKYKELKDEMILNIKQELSKVLQIETKEIKILRISKGSIKIWMTINEKKNKQFFQNKDKSFKDHAKWQGPKFNFKSLLDYFSISPDLLNQKYNMYWDIGQKDDYYVRGSLPFNKNGRIEYVPQQYKLPVEYYGFGLNTQHWKKGDTEWFGTSCSPKTWIVLFHGTNQKSVAQIIKQNLKPGQRNSFGNSKCRITGKSIAAGSNMNTYFSDDTTENGAGRFTQPENNKIANQTYKFIFQCRVNPNCVRSPESQPNYFVVEACEQKDMIIPYRLLVQLIEHS